MLVELKNGETYNGYLVNCDSWMNINLRKVTCTAKDGDKFWRMPAVYIRGNTIKYLCIPDEVLGHVQEEEAQNQKAPAGRGEGRGRGRGRGAGRGGPGGPGGPGGDRGRGRGGEGRGRGRGRGQPQQ